MRLPLFHPSTRSSLFLAAPTTLLAFQTILSCAPLSASLVLSASMSSLSTQVRANFNQNTLSKMSNGEGYVDDVSPRASKLIQDSITLFSAKPSHEIFRRSWTEDAVFEDALCYAKGARQYKAQWWGLAAAFSKCELLAWHVTKDEANQVNYVQRQRYTFAGIGAQKEIISTISMTLNDEGKVIHMQDRWDHKDPPAGFIAWPLRRLNALVVPLFVSIPNENTKPPHTEL